MISLFDLESLIKTREFFLKKSEDKYIFPNERFFCLFAAEGIERLFNYVGETKHEALKKVTEYAEERIREQIVIEKERTVKLDCNPPHDPA